MLSIIYNIQKYLFILEKNINELKTIKDSMIFDISTKEILK